MHLRCGRTARRSGSRSDLDSLAVGDLRHACKGHTAVEAKRRGGAIATFATLVRLILQTNSLEKHIKSWN